MKQILLFMAVFLCAGGAWAKPKATVNTTTNAFSVELKFSSGDLEDSDIIPRAGYCSISAVIAGSDVIEVYQVPASTTTAGAGTLVATFSATTTSPTTVAPAQAGFKVRATTATTGGSKVYFACSNTQVGSFGGGGASSASFDACRDGTVKGGGLDAATGLYAWTCGNYNWSAEVGGIDGNGVSDYNTPTTVGGNSWTMTCTGDGTGTAAGGTPTTNEQAACLYSGETAKMYSGADINLAADNTTNAGKVFLPAGIYHDGYCGWDENQNYNGCPVLQHETAHETRNISMNRGVQLHLESDPDGPHQNGRTGTYVLMDSGDLGGATPDWVGGAGGGTARNAGHWFWYVGMQATSDVCYWDATSGGCKTQSANLLTNGLAVPTMAAFGRGEGMILGDATNTGNADMCIQNDVATSGVCSGDYRVLCTATSGGRLSETTGDCSPAGLGTCLGFADAIQHYHDANDAAGQITYGFMRTETQEHYSLNDNGTGTLSTYYGEIGEVTATACLGPEPLELPGKILRFSPNSDDAAPSWPFGFQFYDQSTQSTPDIIIASYEKVYNEGGGMYGGTWMPSAWIGRDSPTATADCLVADAGDPCDDTDFFSVGAGFGGRLQGAKFFYGGGGGGFAYSAIDGNTSGFFNVVEGNVFSGGRGLGSDSGGNHQWINNRWESWDTEADALIKFAFHDYSTVIGDVYQNIDGSVLHSHQGGFGTIIRDITLISNRLSNGFFRMRGTRKTIYENIRGHGNTGRLFYFDPQTARDSWDITVSNVHLAGHSLVSGVSNVGSAIFSVTDYDGAGAYIGGEVEGWAKLENIFVQANSDEDNCMLWFGGWTGDESDAANGLGRTVDDIRDHFIFDTIAMETQGAVGTGTSDFFCFGNGISTGNAHGDAEFQTTWAGVEGTTPSWRNLRIDDRRYPDSPYASMAAADVGDADDYMDGFVVRIHDDGATACADTAGVLDAAATPSTFQSWCGVNAGSWEPVSGPSGSGSGEINTLASPDVGTDVDLINSVPKTVSALNLVSLEADDFSVTGNIVTVDTGATSGIQAYDADTAKTDVAETLSAAWALGTPSAVVLTNATGTAASLTAGAATALAGGDRDCSVGSVVTGVDADGVLDCAAQASLSSGTASPPGTCTVNDMYNDTDLPGHYVCFTADNWTLVGP